MGVVFLSKKDFDRQDDSEKRLKESNSECVTFILKLAW